MDRMPKYRVMNSHMRREKPPIKYKEIPFKYIFIIKDKYTQQDFIKIL